MGVIRLKAKTGYKTFRTFSSYFTGDLVLTKDVLCHLSHNSIELLVPCTAFILYSIEPLLSTLFSNFIRKKEGGKSIVKLGVL